MREKKIIQVIKYKQTESHYFQCAESEKLGHWRTDNAHRVSEYMGKCDKQCAPDNKK